MSTRIGLAIAHDTIRAVIVRAHKVVWIREVAVDDRVQLAEEITRLLRLAPAPRLRRSVVTAAIGPSLSQVRQIGGLPPLADTKTLGQIVREGTSRFFLRGEAPLLTTGIWIVEPGRVCAGAIDAATVRAVVAGCASARFPLRALTPAVAVIGAGLVGDDLVWADGAIQVRVTLERGELRSVRRFVSRSTLHREDPRPREALNHIEDRGWRFADAYGAALLRHNEPLILRPPRDMAGPRRVPRWRIAIALIVALAAIGGALTARGLAAARAQQDAAGTLGRLAGPYRTALADRADLQRIVAVLEQVAAFESRRHSPTLLLGELARILPERTALTAVRLDSAGGTIVALGPSAANVMITLEKASGLASPEMIGPITQEMIAGEQLERVTIRFRFASTAVTTPGSRTRKGSS
jgi:hypothetical protein